MGGVVAGVPYSASKGGLLAMTKSFARLLAPYGVTVNAIAPGAAETDLTARWPESVRQELRAKVPLGRFIQAEEVAAAGQRGPEVRRTTPRTVSSNAASPR